VSVIPLGDKGYRISFWVKPNAQFGKIIKCNIARNPLDVALNAQLLTARTSLYGT
jgi:hypothetical protein